MVPCRQCTHGVRNRALYNFLQNYPRYSARLMSRHVTSSPCGRSIAAEVVKIRNRAIDSLMEKHGLSLDQLHNLTLKDINLAAQTIAVPLRNGSDFQSIGIDHHSAAALAHFLRVRLPTLDDKLFILEDDRELR